MVRKHGWLACPLVISWFPSPTISLFRAMEGCKGSPPLKTTYPLYKFSSFHIFIHSPFSWNYYTFYNRPFYNIRKTVESFFRSKRSRVYFLIRKFDINSRTFQKERSFASLFIHHRENFNWLCCEFANSSNISQKLYFGNFA